MASRPSKAKRTTSKRKTKAQSQRSELWSHARTGPFVAVASTVETNSSANQDNTRWARSTVNSFQPSNHNNVFVCLDGQHARSRVFGLQTGSQFGYGIYDVDVELVPSYSAVNPEDGRLAVAQIRANYVEPTPLRMDALRHLKAVERLEDLSDAFDSVSSNNDNRAVNPLLGVGVSEDADTADAQTHRKGQRIVRFGFDEFTPLIYAQSSLSVDLNSDDDTGDFAETQFYTLRGDTNSHFGVLPRMEQAVNPRAGGAHEVTRTWANPTNDQMVDDATYQQAQTVWALNPKLENSLGTNLDGGLHTVKAQFRGMRALGGLISLTVPEMFTAGVGSGMTANNDYELLITLRCRKWIPQA